MLQKYVTCRYGDLHPIGNRQVNEYYATAQGVSRQLESLTFISNSFTVRKYIAS
jgi:hypothetical protein